MKKINIKNLGEPVGIHPVTGKQVWSVVKVIEDTLETGKRNATMYWSNIKARLRKEKSTIPSMCAKMKLPGKDNKKRFTDVADYETLCQILAILPSHKTDEDKLYFAQVTAGLTPTQDIQFVDFSNVRRIWVDGELRISIVDVIRILTDQPNTRAASLYWNNLKHRLREEKSELLSSLLQLKMVSTDGKKYLTDTANEEQILRIIQSIPSRKAEPFKMWLAQTGKRFIDEARDPSKAIERGIDTYKRRGWSDKKIAERVKGIEKRNSITSEWCRCNARENIAELTNVMYQEWSGMTAKEYKEFKGNVTNLRDSFSPEEMFVCSTAEDASAIISQHENPDGFEENKDIAIRGGKIGLKIKELIEAELHKPVVTPVNHSQLKGGASRLAELFG